MTKKGRNHPCTCRGEVPGDQRRNHYENHTKHLAFNLKIMDIEKRGCNVRGKISSIQDQVANMDIIYWPVRSSSRRGGAGCLERYFSQLQDLLY